MMLEWLRQASVPEVTGFFLAANVVIFAASVTLCWWIGQTFHDRRLFDRWEPLRLAEMLAAIGAILLNVAVSVVGWRLWQMDLITVRETGLSRALIDCLIMVLAMDFGMYWFHRMAHMPWLFRLIHRFHHRHEATNPISLFVLHPAEVLGFGGLMVAVLILYPMSTLGLMGYLTLNIVFGTLGHSGVEPFPPIVGRLPGLRWLGTSTFHGGHHQFPEHNFGFYTLIWDRLFGTLDPAYDQRFRQSHDAS